jgi:hypothetical protein
MADCEIVQTTARFIGSPIYRARLTGVFGILFFFSSYISTLAISPFERNMSI